MKPKSPGVPTTVVEAKGPPVNVLRVGKVSGKRLLSRDVICLQCVLQHIEAFSSFEIK